MEIEDVFFFFFLSSYSEAFIFSSFVFLPSVEIERRAYVFCRWEMNCYQLLLTVVVIVTDG